MEWKPAALGPATLALGALETFLVEWKRVHGLLLLRLGLHLETFLVEWKPDLRGLTGRGVYP